VRLHVTVRGDEWVGDRRRPTVVGVHGGPGLDGGFLRFALTSVSDFAQVVVPDQRGHGRSDLGTPDEWNLDTWADDLAGLIDVLGLHAPVVLGTSFGGFVVQRYLARHPEQPAGAVLVSTGPRAASQAETVERFRDLGGDDAAAAMALSFAEATERAQQGWAQHCAPLMAVRPTTADVDRVMQARISTPEVNRHFTPLIPEMDLRPGLAAARCPVLVLVGEQDPLVPPSNAEEAVLAVPDGLATLHRIANAGHQLLWDAPDVVEHLLRPFVDRCAMHTEVRT
jgi:pimeloyl-ACP methyl ester carboxylesterase